MLRILLLLTLPLFGQQRIVSTAPALTEILFALGLGPQTVGVTTFCRYPAEAQSKPKIGGYTDPSPERILRLNPTLILIEKGRLWRYPIPVKPPARVLELDTSSLSSLFQVMETIAQAAGKPGAGRELAASIQRDLATIRASIPAGPAPKVVFILGRNPDTLTGMVAAGPRTYLHELILLAGGRNLFDDTKPNFPTVSLEQILRRQPDVIIDRSDMGGSPDASARLLQLWSPYPRIPAVTQNRVFNVTSDAYFVPGPRVVDLARELAALLHRKAPR